jgi:hypothetical protein
MTPELDAQIELFDGIKPPTTWCQIFEPDGAWSVFPAHVDGNKYKVLFLVDDAPINKFIGKKTELKQANKTLGWITIL